MDLPQHPEPQTPRVIVLGAGFGGLRFCRDFLKQKVKAELILIDRQNHHLFQPLLYQVATTGLSAPDIAQPVRSLFPSDELSVFMETVDSIDMEQKAIVVRGEQYHYDYLIIGLGGKTSYFGNDHWSKHALGLKTLEDARKIRNQLLRAFETAESNYNQPEVVARELTVLVCGAGPTGVELAGATAELAKRVIHRDFKHIEPRSARVILLEGTDRVLPMYSDKLSASAKKQLEALGVEVRTGKMIRDIQAGKVVLENETLEGGTILWGAGVEALPIVKSLNAPQGKGGRILVEPDCSVPQHPEVFAIGDTAQCVDVKGTPVPGVAQGAIQMGAHAAKIVAAEIKQDAAAPKAPEMRPAFEYFDKGSMSTIGRSKAVASTFGLEFGGYPAWLAWLGVHLIFLVGFRNRVAVFFSWLYSYFTFRRGARIIIGNDDSPPSEKSEDKREAA